MKKLIILLLSSFMVLSGCSSNVEITTTATIESTSSPAIEITYEFDTQEKIFNNLSDEELLQYLQDSVYQDLDTGFESEDYKVENVITSYLSKEYIEELEYNSKSNIWFGYTQTQVEEILGDTPYIFTLGDNNETIVTTFEGYNDDTYTQMLKNVAIGSGVILLGVTISTVSAATGAATVSWIFACSATTATAVAESRALMSGFFKTVTTSISTGTFDENSIKEGMLAASDSFKSGAIVGAVVGGIIGAFTASSVLNVNGEGKVTTVTTGIPDSRESELYAKEIFGGEEQVTFLNGKEVPYGTPGATRPDLVDFDNKIAYEVKNYDLSSEANVRSLISELRRQVSSRLVNLPGDLTQCLVLDVRGRGYSTVQIETVTKMIQEAKRIFIQIFQ